jgi:hypothetical protein
MSQLLITTGLLASLQAQPTITNQKPQPLSDLPWVKNVVARSIPSGRTVYWVNDFGKIADSNMMISSFIQKTIDGKGPSTDGIDIDSSSWISVENSDIDCNDDDFCLKVSTLPDDRHLH